MAKLDGIEVKVGDRLWDFKYGWGVVKEVFYCGLATISMLFEHNGTRYREYFSENGTNCNDDLYNRTLFWDEIHVTPPPPPKKKVKKWLWVYKRPKGEYKITNNHLSESEANTFLPVSFIRGYFSGNLGEVVYLQKIEDSMIEVEEMK